MKKIIIQNLISWLLLVLISTIAYYLLYVSRGKIPYYLYSYIYIIIFSLIMHVVDTFIKIKKLKKEKE